MRTAISIAEAPNIIAKRWPDWTTFPLFRNVSHDLDDLLFYDKNNDLAEGFFYYPQLDRYFAFSQGVWLALWRADIRRKSK